LHRGDHRDHRRHRGAVPPVRPFAIIVVCGAVAFGCGAKDDPDDDLFDAGIEAGADSALPDATVGDASAIDAPADAAPDAGGPCMAFAFNCPSTQVCVYQGSPSRFACVSPPTMTAIS